MERSHSSKGILLVVGIVTAVVCFVTLSHLFPFLNEIPDNMTVRLPAFNDLHWLKATGRFVD